MDVPRDVNWGVAQSSCGGINHLGSPRTEGFPKIGTISVETRKPQASYDELFRVIEGSKTLTDIACHKHSLWHTDGTEYTISRIVNCHSLCKIYDGMVI